MIVGKVSKVNTLCPQQQFPALGWENTHFTPANRGGRYELTVQVWEKNCF